VLHGRQDGFAAEAFTDPTERSAFDGLYPAPQPSKAI
jgi:hypothetical protein